MVTVTPEREIYLGQFEELIAFFISGFSSLISYLPILCMAGTKRKILKMSFKDLPASY